MSNLDFDPHRDNAHWKASDLVVNDTVVISREVRASTPVSNIRQVEWYETSGGYLARIADILWCEWSVFVNRSATGWYADFHSSLSPSAFMRFGLHADDDTEARAAAIKLLRQMSWHDDYVVPESWVEGE